MRDLTLIVAMFRLLVLVAIVAATFAESSQVFPEGRMTKYDYSIEVKLSVNKINFWTAAKVNSLLEVHNNTGILTTLLKDLNLKMFHNRILTPHNRDEPIMPMLYYPVTGKLVDIIREEMQKPTSFKMNTGHIENVTFAGEHFIAKNVKRGLIQLLQAPPTIRSNFIAGHTERRYEASVLGFCETTYIYSPCNISLQCQEVIKRINMKKCIGVPLKKNTEMNPRVEKIKNETINEVVTMKYMTFKQQDETVIERVSGYSILYETPTMKRDGQVTVQFIQSLLRRSSEVSDRQAPNNLTESTGIELIAEIPLTCENKMSTDEYVTHIDDLLKVYREKNSSLAYIVYEIKNLLRCADQEKFDKLLTKYSSDPLNLNLLWDIIPAVDSVVVREALKKVTVAMLVKKPLLLTLYAEHQTFDKETFDVMKKLVSQILIVNKTLQTSAYLALSNYGHKCIRICEKLKLKYIQESGLLNSTEAKFPQVPHGTGLLMEKLKEEMKEHKLIRTEMLTFFLELLESSTDKVLPLKLLKNFGDPESLPVLVDIIKNNKNMTYCVLAVDSLLRMPLDTLVTDENSTLIKLYMSVNTSVPLRLRLFKALITNSLNDNVWQILVSSIRYEPNCYVAKWAHTYIRQLANSEYRPIKLWTLKALKAMAVWPIYESPCFDSQKGVMDIYRLLKERIFYPIHISTHLESIQENIALDIQLLPITNSSCTLILRGRITSKLVHHDYELQLQVYTLSLEQALTYTSLWLLKDAGVVFSFEKDSLESRSKLLELAEVFVSSKEQKIPTIIGALLHDEQSRVYIPKVQISKVEEVIELTNPRWFSYWESRTYLDGQYMKPGIGVYEEIKLSVPGVLKINIKDQSVSITLQKDKTPIFDVYKSFYNFIEFEPIVKLMAGFIPRMIQDDLVQPDSRLLACALALGPVHIGGVFPESWRQPASAIISLIYGIHHNRVFVETEDVTKIVKVAVDVKHCKNESSGRIVNLILLSGDGSKYVDVSGGLCWVVEETQLKAEVLVELMKKEAEKKQFKVVVKVPLRKPAPLKCLWDKDYQQQVKELLANVSQQHITMLPYLVPHWQARMADELNVLTQYSSSKPDPIVTFIDPVKDREIELLQLEVLEKVEEQRLSISSLSVRKDFTKLCTEVILLNDKVIKYVSESLKISSHELLEKVKYFHLRNVVLARQLKISKFVEDMFKVILITIDATETSQREHLKKQLISLQKVYIEKVNEHINTTSQVIWKELPVERRALYENVLRTEKLYLQLNPTNINETSRNISLRLDLLLRELPQLFDFDSQQTEILMLEAYRLKFYPTVLLNVTLCQLKCKFQKILLKSWQLQQDVVVYEKLLSEIRFYNMTCDKLSASCFSLNLKYMVLRLLHDLMEYKRASWENIIEEKPEKVFSSFRQLYQTLEVGVKLVEMKEPNLQTLAEDGGLPLYIELNEFLVKLQQISLYILNEPSTGWHEIVSQSTDMKKKELKKSIVDLFVRVQRIANVESSKLVKPQIHSKSKTCDIPKSILVEVIFEVDEKPLITVKADFQKTIEQLKKEVDIALLYMVDEQTLERPYRNITKDLTRGLNSYKSVWISVDWKNETLPQRVVTVLGHVRDCMEYLLRDYLVIISIPESKINGIEIGVQQMMKSKMVNVHLHAGSKIYLLTSIPVPIDLLITPPSYKVVMSGLEILKTGQLKSSDPVTSNTTVVTTTPTPVTLMAGVAPTTKQTKESYIIRRNIRSAEQSKVPTTSSTPVKTTETLLSNIIKGTVSTVAPELKILGSESEDTMRSKTMTTPKTKPAKLHKIVSTTSDEIKRGKSITFAPLKITLPTDVKPSVETSTTMKPLQSKEDITTSHTSKSPRQAGAAERVSSQTSTPTTPPRKSQ